MSTNESADVVVEKPMEEKLNNTNENIDETHEESDSSNSTEETVKKCISNILDMTCDSRGHALILANNILRSQNVNEEVIILNEHDLLSQFLNGDVSNIFSDNKSIFKDLLDKDICSTYEVNFDQNSKCTLLTNKNDLQISEDILLLGNESEETNKLLDLWKRVMKNEESKLYLLKRNLYQQHLKLRNRSRLSHDKLNNILNECNVLVKKYNNNYDKTINNIFKEWSTVTPHNIFEFKLFIKACRLTWRKSIKNLHAEYTELLKRSFN